MHAHHCREILSKNTCDNEFLMQSKLNSNIVLLIHFPFTELQYYGSRRGLVSSVSAY